MLDLETSKKLTQSFGRSENRVPLESDPQPEDIVDSENESVEDDSDVPLHVLIKELTEKKVYKGFAINKKGTLVADRDAEKFESTITSIRILDVGKDINNPIGCTTTTLFGATMMTTTRIQTAIE